MTREEAIMVLKNEQPHCGKKALFPEEKKYEAFNVAIKALEQEPCEDAISRQAVLDYIDKMPSELTADGRRMIRRRTLEEYISDTLPSVNPQEPKTGYWKRISMDKYSEHAMYWYRCDKCGKDNLGYTAYCPNCGARMFDPQESEEV